MRFILPFFFKQKPVYAAYIPAFIMAACLLSSCAGTPKGYDTNAQHRDDTYWQIPTGYNHAKYKDDTPSTTKADRIAQKQIDQIAHQASFEKIATELAFSIDNQIGLETNEITLNITSQRQELAASLDHYLRQALVDLDYNLGVLAGDYSRLDANARPDYYINIHADMITSDLEYIRQEPADQADHNAQRHIQRSGERIRHELNEGGDTAIFKAKPRQKNRNLLAQTTIMHDGKPISRVESKHNF